MGISLNTILAALSGGAGGYAQGLERQRQQRRQDMLDQQLMEDRASQREAREYENVGRMGRMAEDGYLPASAIPPQDQTDFSGAISAGVGAVGGVAPPMPAKLPDPQRYAPVGRAGGQEFYYNPAGTKEARARTEKETARAAEVSRLMQFTKPGTSQTLTRPEAAAIVDGNARLSDFEQKVSPYSDTALEFDRKRETFRAGLRERAAEAAQKRKVAAGTAGMEIDEREKYLNAVADRAIEDAAVKAGPDNYMAILHAADEWGVNTPEGKSMMQRGLRAGHVRAALQRHKDRFTSKSKLTTGPVNPFLPLTGDSTETPDPVTPAPARPAPAGKPIAPDSLVAELAKKHRGDIEAVANELAARGFDPTQ